MAKNRRLKYRIYRLELSKILQYFFGRGKDSDEAFILRTSHFVYSKSSNLEDNNLQDDCALYYQLLLEKYNEGGEDEADKKVKEIYKAALEEDGVIEDLAHTLVLINFGETLDKIENTNNHYYREMVQKILDPINGGFTIEFENGESVRFVSFFKSNSMSKKKVLTFVDAKYHNNLIKRSLLELNVKKEKLSLSRFYAYTGLSMSGGIRLDINKDVNKLGHLEFDENHIIIVDDYQLEPRKTWVRPLITMASKDNLTTVIKNILFIKGYLVLNDGHELNEKEIALYNNDSFHTKCKDIRGWIGNGVRKKERYESYLDFYKNYLLDDAVNIISAFGITTILNSLELSKDNIDKYISNYVSKNLLSIFEYSNGNFEKIGKETEQIISDLTAYYEEDADKKNEKRIVINKNTVGNVLVLKSFNKSPDQFDGEGLISPRYSEIINQLYTDDRYLKEGKKHTSFQIRLPLVKGMLHTVDFKSFYEEECMQQYFVDIDTHFIREKDGIYYLFSTKEEKEKFLYPIPLRAISKNGEKYILDMFGIYRKLKDVEIILTAGQLKKGKITSNTSEYDEDFMKAYFKYFNKYHHSLYITGADSIDHKGEEETELNYQFLSTAGLNGEEADIVTKEQRTRIEKLFKGDYQTLKETFELDKGEELVEFNVADILNSVISEDDDEELNSKIYEGRKYPALKYNENLKYTNAVREEINALALKEIKELSIGHIKFAGELRYLSGDLLVFLYYIVGGKENEIPSEERLKKYSFYAPGGRFYKDEEPLECVLLRNPHISKNENTVSKPWVPFEGSLREKYFRGLDFVCMINGASLIQERLGGADYDGDETRIISDPLFVKSVKQDKYYKEPNFVDRQKLGIIPNLYETAVVPSIDTIKENGDSIDDGVAIYDTLLNTFGSKVGQYSNDGFKAACVAYSPEHIGDQEHEMKVVEYYLTVGLEVDSAKSGTKPQKPKQLVKDSDEIFSSAISFLHIKDILTADAEKSSIGLSEYKAHESNAVLALDRIGNDLLSNNEIYKKDKAKLESIMSLPEEDKVLTDKIKAFISYYNQATSTLDIRKRYDNSNLIDLIRQILIQNYPSNPGEITELLYEFITNYGSRLKERPDFAKIAILTDREAREEIINIFSLTEDEAIFNQFAIETLARHHNNMSKVFNLMYFLYLTTFKSDDQSQKEEDIIDKISDEDVKNFVIDLHETISSKFKRGIYSRRENKDSLLKINVLKKHINMLFNNDDKQSLAYIFMLDTIYDNKIPSWVLWDLYSKDLLKVVKREK